MMKHFFNTLLALLLLFTFYSCENNKPTELPDEFEVRGEPISLEFNVSPDSLKPESYTEYSTDYNKLELCGVYMTDVKYLWPNTFTMTEVNREFVLTTNDSFVVEIRNCKIEREWMIDLGSINLTGNNNWTNNSVTLLRREESINSDSTINYKHIFKTIGEGKGYICFIEKNKDDWISSNESHGLLIGYNVKPLRRMFINLDKIEWIYNIEEGTFSTVHVKVEGSTNAYRLRGLTHGDGELSAMEIPVQSNSHFEIEIPVAFSHVEGVVLKTSAQLILYGTIGLPKVIQLVNPKSD
jgi:hypothetical protein